MAQLSTVTDILNEVLVRTGENTTVAFYTDAKLATYLANAYKFCVSYKLWPLTEGKFDTTWSGGETTNYPENWRTDGIRMLQVGGKRMTKLNFDDYQAYREDFPSGQERIYTDFARLLYINPNIDSSGTLTTWGQFLPTIDPTELTTTTIFSGGEEDGNEAVVEEMLSYAKMQEDNFDESTFHHQRAVEILDRLWERISLEQYPYQTKNRSLFKRFDVLKGALREDLIKRDQFYSWVLLFLIPLLKKLLIY